MIKGKDLIVTWGRATNVIAAATSCSIEVSTDFITAASPTEGSWKDKIPTFHSWSLSSDALVSYMANYNELLNYQLVKEKLMLCFYDADLGAFYKGYGYIKNIKLTGAVRGLAKMSISFESTGALEAAQAVSVPMDYGTDLDEYYLFWPETGKMYVYPKAGEQGDQIKLEEVTVTKKTRFTVRKHAVLFKASMSTVIGHIQNLDAASLNALAVLYSGESSVDSSGVFTSGTYTIAVNASEADQGVDSAEYLSII